jgi:adenylate cyclase
MADVRTNRRLAAILAADVVGYSRMMESDEAGTLAALRRHREAVFNPTVEQNNGRVVKLIGDGTLVEFGSVVDAVNCAVSVQNAIAADQSTPRIVLRIGINLGDVIFEADDIYGDGVNVAARLEPLAPHGGICVASIVNESVGNRINIVFEDGGEVHVKNIERPIRVWKWVPGAMGAVKKEAASPPAPVVAAKRSIAVLPFANMSGDAEQEYFSDGIAEDIITDLSKLAELAVIARNSTFSYKGRNVDIRTIGRELGVTHVLEGSVRRAGNRVRITAQLIGASNGSHLWAERYDRDLTDIFAVQDEVTRKIVEALKLSLSPAETAALATPVSGSVEAHDLFLRGRQLLFGSVKNREIFDQTNEFFRKAIALDPDYAEPYAGLAVMMVFDYQNRWSDDPDGSLKEAGVLAAQAIERDPKEAFAHHAMCLYANFTGQPERTRDEANAAIALNPSFAPAYTMLGTTHIFGGDPLNGVPLIEKAMSLDPMFAQQYLHFLGLAYLVAGKYETASVVFRQRILLVPETDFTRAFLAVALGHLGEVDEARKVWSELKAINPKYSFDAHMGRLPFKDKGEVEKLKDGLKKAGLPD